MSMYFADFLNFIILDKRSAILNDRRASSGGVQGVRTPALFSNIAQIVPSNSSTSSEETL